MAQFSRLVLTKKGQALIAKVMGGEESVSYTKVAASSASYKEPELQELTELTDIRQEVTPSRIERTNETAIEVETAFLNIELTVGYYVKALGLYATDPDEGEILFAATVEESGGCYMPAYNGRAVSGLYVNLVTTIGNAESVSLEIDPAGIVTVGILNGVLEGLRQELKKEMEKTSHSHENKDILDTIDEQMIKDWDSKQNAEEGKGLSEENYTLEEKEKLSSVEPGAQPRIGVPVYISATAPSNTDGLWVVPPET